MLCPKCPEEGVLRRMPRTGVLEEKFLFWLGYYPWECSGCRKRMMLKRRGFNKTGRAPASGLTTN